jgi:hypothetical protein
MATQEAKKTPAEGNEDEACVKEERRRSNLGRMFRSEAGPEGTPIHMNHTSAKQVLLFLNNFHYFCVWNFELGSPYTTTNDKEIVDASKPPSQYKTIMGQWPTGPPTSTSREDAHPNELGAESIKR